MNKIAQYRLIEKAARAKRVPVGCSRPDEPLEAKKLRRAKNAKARKLRQKAALERRSKRIKL